MADVYLRRKPSGKPDSFYFRRVRLRTKNANEARDRARLVVEGEWDGKGEPPAPKDAAKVTAAAFAIVPPPAPEPAPAPPPAPPELPPAPPAPEPLTGEWTHAAAGAAAETSAPAGEAAPPPPEPSSEQLAELLVEAELKIAEIYIQQTVYEPFVAPKIADAGRTILTGAYRQMIDYGGAVIQMPPWVKGLVVPAMTVVISSLAIVAGFRDAALAQKRTADGGA